MDTHPGIFVALMALAVVLAMIAYGRRNRRLFKQAKMTNNLREYLERKDYRKYARRDL